jgi:Xaa-Pro aminopeptidase
MRLGDFQKVLKSKQINGAIFFDSDPHVFYFTGIELEHCTLFIPSEGDAFILTSVLEEERTKKNSRVKRVVAYSKNSERESILREALSGSVIGINKEKITVNALEYVQSLTKTSFVDISSDLTELRMVKTDEEIQILKEACKITDLIIEDCISSFNFKKELNVKLFLEKEVRKRGLFTSFETIVASGSNASMPHYFGNDKIVKGFCVIDFGIKFKGYCSDITRTVFVGNPKKKEIDEYDSVLGAQQSAIDKVSDGVVAGDIDLAARESLGDKSKFFIHGLGHHIGIEVHDNGFRIGQGSKGILRAGMVITVEPGVYYSGRLGIRIEDDVLVKNSGHELLTLAKKELICTAKSS